MANNFEYNWRIFGQDDLVKRLEDDLSSDRISHATLLTGPDKIGKLTIMKKLAQILQCGNDFSPENPIYKEIEEGRHLDTYVLSDEGGSLKIDQIREIKNFVQLSRQGEYKIVIVKNIQRMSVPAANSLLKILEEPPNKVFFFLSTADSASVLPTIISRCRLYRGKLASTESIIGYLTNHFPDLDEKHVKKIALFSAGRVGRAVELVQDADLFDKYDKWYQELSVLDKSDDLVTLFKYADEIASLEKHELEDFFVLFLQFIRFQMRHVGSEKRIRYANAANVGQKSYSLVHSNVNARLVLEVLFLQAFTDFCRLRSC